MQARVRRLWWGVVAFALSAGGATLTANALYPLSRIGYRSLPAWAVGLIVSELPLQNLAVQTASVGATSWRAGPRLRLASWVLWALSAAGLGFLWASARRSDGPLRAALDTGLGEGRRTDGADLWMRPPAEGATAKTPGLARMIRIYRDYAHDANISYGPYGGANLLDIWRRPDLPRDGRAPVLLQVHGGAWIVGNKRGQAHPLMSHLAELGWVCVSINYRRSPRNTWPDHITDVKRAIAWVKEHIGEYGGDPDFVAITGGSAGGHLSSLAALTPNDPQFQAGFEDVDTAVQAAVPFYGVYDFTGAHAKSRADMIELVEQLVFKSPLANSAEVYNAASTITWAAADAQARCRASGPGRGRSRRTTRTRR